MVAVSFATPVTRPVELTVAIAVLLLLQVPPAVASVNCEVNPLQIAALPAIGLIGDCTVAVTPKLIELPLQPLLTGVAVIVPFVPPPTSV